jgi:predicted acylesterase/phospholipase RssA
MNRYSLRGRDTLLLGGGGLKTLAFCGALETLDLSAFKTVVGLSAGSILALGLCLGYGPAEMSSELQASDALSLVAGTLTPSTLFQSGGLCDSLALAGPIAGWMRKKGYDTETTFIQLRSKSRMSLRVIAAQLPGLELKVFDANSDPDVAVLRAVLASSAVPVAFAPVKIGTVLYVDAGIVDNLGLFSCRECAQATLALRAGDSPLELERAVPRCLKPWVRRCAERMLLLEHAELSRWGSSALVIRMPPLPGSDYHLFRLGRGRTEDFQLLLDQGRLAARAYLLGGYLLLALCGVVAWEPWGTEKRSVPSSGALRNHGAKTMCAPTSP